MCTKYYGCQSAAIIAAEIVVREYGFHTIYDNIYFVAIKEGESVDYEFRLYDLEKEEISDKIVCIRLSRSSNGGYEVNTKLSKCK